jgi:hypothetical protein
VVVLLYRIKMLFLPWMAAQYSLETKPNSFEGTVFCNGFFGIFGTGWGKNTVTAVSETKFVGESLIRREVFLVEIDTTYEKFTHEIF